MISKDDRRWLTIAATLAERGRPSSAPNPAVGAVLVKDAIVIGRGWTQAGGRPHAEAMAFAQTGQSARGATLYVTLEPCAHHSERGPACADLAAEAGIKRLVVGVTDPDPRTAGSGMERLRAAGVEIALANDPACGMSLAGYLCRTRYGRPHITLKLAMSLDGAIATASGQSQWITGDLARAHTHRERARADAILVGGATLRSDTPQLNVRLPGLEDHSPERWVLSSHPTPDGWHQLPAVEELGRMAPHQYLFVEGGSSAAASFLRADLVDRLLIYRAPILIGGGKSAIADYGLDDLASAHNIWSLSARRQLGRDTLEVYDRTPCSPE
ncbi:bifunctional diaminohydroxyphosphoribosylaminopyrimidine deaminase/5-amino-6-(5-phosphoribosylamino)uracil reductase RibD [Altericroceibacterium endophyticum]|uniref:bifunctional diaminohydroxyphosphoribosylaminopyrimidine deaminase/5-amino-6-(5-phosphoribosylamino)uracil reductase RibD n=1 Tax=Altericroceibacterium endophyticum TaxID=1808508 RepID=UPI00301BE6C9